MSRTTIRRWSDEGFLGPCETVGGQRRFSAAQIEQFAILLKSGDRLRPTRPR